METIFKYINFSVFLFITSFGLSQNQASNWYFGQNAGLSFGLGYPAPLENGQLVTEEGCSTISDGQGNLLFYSDGITVWNKNHQVMQNGTDLLGDESSTQSALIVPKPGSDNIYYIFTVDDRAGNGGLRFSEVNMLLNNGLGGVTSNKNIELENPSTEKITAVESSNGTDIWVIGHKWESNEFVAFLVTDTGINTSPIISSIGSFHGGDGNNTIGYLKASPDRSKIVSVKSYDNSETQIFDFNATTGILSNPITISNYTSDNIGAYGCEFSPDSKLLYISEIDLDNDVSKIHQYDLTQTSENAIINSDIIIAEEQNTNLGALQQAVDGKIYIAIQNANYLGVISNPNEIGLNCNYQFFGVNLGTRTSRLGLPPFIQSYFFATNIFNNTCFGDSTEFSINTQTTIDNILWDFGDPASGSNNTATELNPTHVYTSPGEFLITITLESEGQTQLIYRNITISEQPEPLDLDPLLGCEDSNGFATFNLISAIPDDINSNPNIGVTFYESLQDAEDRQNTIVSVNNFENTSGLQTLYVRLQNILSVDCYSISELELITALRPIVEEFDTAFFCENNPGDSVTIDVGPLEDNLTDYNFLWLESQETTPEIMVQSQGNYTVRITPISTISAQNPDGCYAERVVTVSSSSIATINNVVVNFGNTITVFVSGIGDYEFAVDDINGPYQDSSQFTNLEPGVHTVYVRDKNDCGIAENQFSIIGFPKVFTPNGDGTNDVWQVKGLIAQFQPNAKIYIFNRYGKLMKELLPTSVGWDGTFNGNPLPTGGYWFSVQLQDGSIYKDHFTLKR
ncbi:T9SS type B sorting domain-containing protein [Hanstruepera ponticola]|uniref:T9SS type B sorting domain-containing protein n=1 Tax=Hanstruepera ponticola TaxID=2042995 RepID=UPI000CF0AF23|nr:T9SS type B sorting domain-containing protein [Hanstruepera ponticola]